MEKIQGKRNRNRVAQRRAEALLRQESRNKRSASEQIELLNTRLGKSHGAKKERLRLKKELEALLETKKGDHDGKSKNRL